MGNNGNGNGNSFTRSKLAKSVASALHQEKLGHRPSMYRGEQSDLQAYKLALLGATDKQMADVMCISVETLVRWRNEYPTFCQSIINGKDEADARVAESLLNRALGYEHADVHISVFRDKETGEVEKVITPITKHYPPDTTACIFWLKNRQRDHWRDVSRREITGPDNGPIKHNVNLLTLDLSKLSDAELQMAESIGLALNKKRLEDGSVIDVEATDGEQE